MFEWQLPDFCGRGETFALRRATDTPNTTVLHAGLETAKVLACLQPKAILTIQSYDLDALGAELHGEYCTSLCLHDKL